MPDPIRVLYVDDEPDLLELGKIYLEQSEEFGVETSTSARGALDSGKILSHDIIVSDYQMPDMNGIDFLRAVREQYGDLPFILFTGRGREEVVIAAINNGADFYLQKGGDPTAQFAELAHQIRHAVTRRKAQGDLRLAYEQITASEEELRGQYEELALSERRIRESEASVTSIFRAAPVGIGLLVDRRLVRVNDRFCEITGYPSDEILGMDTRILYPDEEEFSRVGSLYLGKFGTESAVKTETRWRRKDGTVRDILLTGTAVEFSNPAAGMIFTSLDITEEKQAHDKLRSAYETIARDEEELRDQFGRLAAGEEKLRQSEEMYRTLIEHSRDGFIILQDGRLVFYNRGAFASMTGWTIDELVGKSIADLVAPEDRERALQRYQKRFQGEAVPEYVEYSLLHRDGTSRVLIRMYSSMGTYRGRPALLGTLHNITEDRKRENALRESEERYRTLVDASFDGIAIHQDGRIVYVNPTGARLLGAEDPARFIGKPATEIIHPDDIREILPRIRQSSKDPQELLHERFLKADGSILDVDVTASPFIWNERPASYVTFRDISDKLRAEEALRESEEKYRTLVEKANEAIIIVQDLHLVFVNSSMVRLLGVPAENLIGRPVTEFIWPDDRGMVLARHAPLHEGERIPDGYDFRIIGPGGSPIWVFISAAKIAWEGRPATLNLMTDITGRKAAEEALREREKKLRWVIENAPEAIYIASDWKFTYLNPAAVKLFGVESPEDLIGTPFLDRVHPRFHEIIRSRVHQLYDEKTPAPLLEEVYLRCDGSEIEVEVASVPFAVGERSGALVFIRDISDRKRAEAARRESEEQYRRILENLQDAYFQIDREGLITMANNSAAAMYGYPSPEEMIGIPVSTLYQDPGQRSEVLKRMGEGARINDFIGIGRRRDGTTLWVSVNTQFIRGPDGSVTGTEGIVRDITQRKVLEQAVQEANRKLNLLNTITRHDVMNQLTILQGYAQLAGIRTGDPVTTDFLQKITTAAETISHQIEFTKMYQELGVTSPVWSRLDESIAKAGRAGVVLAGSCRNIEICADPMLERVFFNLFENAIRHGERVTSIAVRCERAPDGLVILVEDDGIGIPPEEKERIFEKGVGKNTGFGLFLAREILAITGITIRETGYAGVGARFEITVPKEMYRYT